jgi:hypothetical protein
MPAQFTDQAQCREATSLLLRRLAILSEMLRFSDGASRDLQVVRDETMLLRARLAWLRDILGFCPQLSMEAIAEQWGQKSSSDMQRLWRTCATRIDETYHDLPRRKPLRQGLVGRTWRGLQSRLSAPEAVRDDTSLILRPLTLSDLCGPSE